MTAYAINRRDWSSDVCSSDLLHINYMATWIRQTRDIDCNNSVFHQISTARIHRWKWVHWTWRMLQLLLYAFHRSSVLYRKLYRRNRYIRKNTSSFSIECDHIRFECDYIVFVITRHHFQSSVITFDSNVITFKGPLNVLTLESNVITDIVGILNPENSSNVSR